MQNNDLKSLVTQMYDDVLDLIDKNKNATKEQVLGYLKDAVLTVETIDDSELDSIEHAKAAFTSTYKEIVEKSLSSYKDTNGKFEELAQIQEKTIDECQAPHIDLPLLTQKFNEIQTHMSDEVKKANAVISQLSNQVKVLEEKTNIDALTKVFNRRSLISYLNKICTNDNMKYDLHFLMLDVDDFKIVNDSFGHVAGDKILIYIANVLKRTLRDGDKIFRYGGEEFAIVLNRVDDNTCKLITSRILDLLRENKLIYKGQEIQVTASIGSTKYIKNDTPDKLIARADKALYRAKSTGKNRMYSEV
jgi:diguanylate cyclase